MESYSDGKRNASWLTHFILAKTHIKESLGSCRRNQISTLEYPKERRRHGPSLSTVEAARLSNRPGTQENRDSQANQAQLSAWNSEFLFLLGACSLKCLR